MSSLTFNAPHQPCPYKITTLILDSSCRDTSAHPNPNTFRLKLASPLKNVVALRILRTEFVKLNPQTSEFFVNDFEIPLQTMNMEPAYVYINGWQNCVIGAADDNAEALPVVTRVVPGNDQFPSVTLPIQSDPFMIHFYPSEPRLNAFDVRVYQQNGQLYQDPEVRIVLTLAAYCVCGAYNQ